MTRRRKNPLNSSERLKAANPQKTTVREYFGPFATNTRGARIGIEVEVETLNDRYPNDGRVNDTSSFWLTTIDNSLRNAAMTGTGGREYISKGSIKIEDAEWALAELETFLRSAKSKVRRSNRTSVHVHCNVQDYTLSQLMVLFSLYYVVEPILCRFNGFEREHNLFCLQAINAPNLIQSLMNFLRTKRIETNLKYSALNFMPLARGSLGTVEFRAGQGIEKSPLEALPWINLIEEVLNAVKNFDTPSDILSEISSLSALPFVKKTFPKIYAQGVHLYSSTEELEYTLMQSMRNMQAVAYDIDWSDYVPASPVLPLKATKRRVLAILDRSIEEHMDYCLGDTFDWGFFSRNQKIDLAVWYSSHFREHGDYPSRDATYTKCLELGCQRSVGE